MDQGASVVIILSENVQGSERRVWQERGASIWIPACGVVSRVRSMADENVGSSPRLAARVLRAGEVTRNLFFTRMLVHVGQSTLRRIVVPMSCDKLAFEFPGDEAFERIILEVDGSVGAQGLVCVAVRLGFRRIWRWRWRGALVDLVALWQSRSLTVAIGFGGPFCSLVSGRRIAAA